MCRVPCTMRCVFPRECCGIAWHPVVDSLKDFLLYCCCLSAECPKLSFEGVEVLNFFQSSVQVWKISGSSKKFQHSTICKQLLNNLRGVDKLDNQLTMGLNPCDPLTVHTLNFFIFVLLLLLQTVKSESFCYDIIDMWLFMCSYNEC